MQSSRLPTDDDLIVGSLSWPGLRSWATADPAGFNGGERDSYKVGALIKAGAVVTVAVPNSIKDKVGLKYGQGWAYEPAQSVTFHGCQDFDTAYVGGFYVVGHRCVPLDITERGKPPVRVTISFFAGRC